MTNNRKNWLYISLLTIAICSVTSTYAQKNEWVEQVIIANGGRMETTPPFLDYVTMQYYLPGTQSSGIFDTIRTQSVQDMVVSYGLAYVAAQDSIVKYNLDTYERLAAVKDSGLSRIALYKDLLLVSKKFPSVYYFLEALHAPDLTTSFRLQLPGEAAGIAVLYDSAYIACNGGSTNPMAKIAVVNLKSKTVKRVIDLGTSTNIIHDIYTYGNYIIAIFRTPENGTTGNLAISNILNGQTNLYNFSVSLGKGVDVYNDLLFLGINNGIGSINIPNHAIVDTTIIPDPGFVNHIYITRSDFDYINERFYMNIGNNTTFGICGVATVTGDSVTTFATGLAAEAIAIDFRTPVGIENKAISEKVSIYPNPVTDKVTLFFHDLSGEKQISLVDVMGREYLRFSTRNEDKSAVELDQLPQGVYFLNVQTSQFSTSKKIIRK